MLFLSQTGISMPRDRDDDDDNDDDRPRRRRKASGDSGVAGVIPYRNGSALAAYYCGIFGLIPCILGLGLFGLVPIVLGVLGLMKAKQNPEAHGAVHAWIGIVLGAIEALSSCGVIVWIIIG